jgi:hypothetical protein
MKILIGIVWSTSWPTAYRVLWAFSSILVDQNIIGVFKPAFEEIDQKMSENHDLRNFDRN